MILVYATANDIGRMFVEKLHSLKKTKRGLGSIECAIALL